MTNSREKEARDGLVRLVGGQKADEILSTVRIGKGLTQFDERQLSTQADLKPLSQQQADAINAHLGTNLQAGGQSDKK